MDVHAVMKRGARQLATGNTTLTALSQYGEKLPPEDELRSRVDAFLNAPDASRSPVSARLRSEIEQVLQSLYGQSGVHRAVVVGPALESVIIADGARPVMFIEDDKLVQTGTPDGPFVDFLKDNRVAFETAALAVGRVETDDHTAPAGLDCWYEGSAFLVSGNLAMTNRHVLERMVYEPESPNGPYHLKGQYWLNFGAELYYPAPRRFAVEGVAYVGPSVIGSGGDFTHLDLALLRIGPPRAPETVLPAPLPVTLQRLRMGEKVAVVGYPSAPYIYTGVGTPPADYELESVLRSVFDERFGYKRCASGEIDSLTGFPGDTRKWTIQHDASTLSGNSGSPVLALVNGVATVAALHFAGTPRVANYAHVFDQLAADFDRLGITLH